jgi:guanyl-specific ribonuclease Sa
MRIRKKLLLRAGLAAAILAAGLLLRAGGESRSAAPPPSAPPAAAVRRDGEYTGRDEVAAYVRRFGGALPRNFITKAQARALGWQGGPLEPFAPGKSIGGDRFGNYERRLPPSGRYKECDIDTRGRPRGVKRLVFTSDGRRIYYTQDHYGTFEELHPGDAP